MIATLGLVACQREAVRLTPEEMEHLKLKRMDPTHDRPISPVVTEFGPEEGVGEVVAVDPVALTVALRHRQRSREDWPGMVMTFRIRRALVGTVEPGERVYFRALQRDGAGEIVYIQAVPRR